MIEWRGGEYREFWVLDFGGWVMGVLGWFCLFNVSRWGPFSCGSGTDKFSYLIFTAADLQAIGFDSVHWNKDIKLIVDLDLAGVAITPLGTPGKFFMRLNGILLSFGKDPICSIKIPILF